MTFLVDYKLLNYNLLVKDHLKNVKTQPLQFQNGLKDKNQYCTPLNCRYHNRSSKYNVINSNS